MAADEHDHSHGEIHFQGTDVTDGTLAQIKAVHEPLAECLDLTQRWSQLSDDEKKAAPEKQRAVELFPRWTPGYHADGDRCATCGLPTLALYTDRFQEGELAYGAFHHGLPVHATPACLDGFAAAQKDLSPRGVDKARRGLMRDLDRPTPAITQFFRHDVLAHPPFGLEDWANSVAAANPKGLDRQTMRDIERLAQYVHRRLYHH